MFWIVLRWGSHDSRSLLVKFLAFCICFSSFLHDFCVEYLRRTNFSRATRFLVDLPAHGGAVGFFISGFVATALAIAPRSMPAGAAQLAHDPRRSPTMANICAERRHPMAREIACDFGSKIFEIFRRPEKFSFEIA